ncbi:MAG: transposase family protein [Firmicutes bacterium]|nr:transposase family protein [Bacillota bacterium]
MSGGAKNTRLQEQVIAYLLVSPSVEQAAEKAGVGVSTVWRWLREDLDFRERYQQAKREVINHAVTLLGQSCTDAVAALRNIVNDVEAPASARVSAARVILETALRGVELEDLAARIEVLERIINQKGAV